MYLWYIFDTLLNVHWRKSYALFFMHPNHRVRREMVESLARVVWAEEPAKLKELTKLLDRIKRASNKRNAITHGLWNERPGAPSEFVRLPLKRDPATMKAAKAFSLKDLRNIRDEIDKLDIDLFEYAYSPWSKSASRENGRA